MAYAEKRKGVLTGLWMGEVETKAHGRFKRSFDKKRDAEAYEAFVKTFGYEPPALAEDGKTAMPAKGRSFREVAQACKDAGGPHGKWHNGKDDSVLQRLDFVIEQIGAYDIADVSRVLLREKVADKLKTKPRPGKDRSKKLKQGTINRYVTAGSAVLTYAVNEGILTVKPQLEFKQESDRAVRSALAFSLEDRVVAWLREHGLPLYATLVRFFAISGLRRGELWKLAPEQIETDHIVLKGDQTKNERPRPVYIGEETAREIRAIVASKALPDPTHLLKMFQKACRACGEKKTRVLHELRHSRNTRLRKAGVKKEIRKEMLGHMSDEVNDMYDHIDLADQRAAFEAVEKLRGELHGGPNVVPFDPSKKSA